MSIDSSSCLLLWVGCIVRPLLSELQAKCGPPFHVLSPQVYLRRFRLRSQFGLAPPPAHGRSGGGNLEAARAVPVPGALTSKRCIGTRMQGTFTLMKYDGFDRGLASIAHATAIAVALCVAAAASRDGRRPAPDKCSSGNFGACTRREYRSNRERTYQKLYRGGRECCGEEDGG